jgi:FkbM family methyltransferase
MSIPFFKLSNGRTIYCDRPDKVHAEQAIADFDNMFFPFLNGKSMWAIDIGTSCGDSTVVMAGQLLEGSKIIAFEPSREIYPLLIENTSKNPYVTYDVHTVAAGNSFYMENFVYGIDNGGLVIPDLISERERGNAPPSYKVEVVQSYTYLRSMYSVEELDKIQFIKIDTEGYDYVVLKGLAPLIYRNRMPIIVEWWNNPSNNNRLFNVIDSLYYEAFNTLGEKVTRFDFPSPKRTQDLILRPI